METIPPDPTAFDRLLAEVRACRVCADHLPLGPRPVLRATVAARVLIIGQAPGTRVHETGIPWNDASGKRLRRWLDMDDRLFYDAGRIYQGASVLVPKTIPVFNYAQAMILGASPENTLRTMDQDWARLAFRQPAASTTDSAPAAAEGGQR